VFVGLKKRAVAVASKALGQRSAVPVKFHVSTIVYVVYGESATADWVQPLE
jgi:hypothetical protein